MAHSLNPGSTHKATFSKFSLEVSFREAAGRRVPDKLQVLFPNAQKLEEAYQQQDATNAEYRQLDRLSNCIASWHGS